MSKNIFRYGIIVKSRKIDEEEEEENWGIVTIGPTPEDSSTIIAPTNIFDFIPKLGDCVKIKFKVIEEDEEPVAISREAQWIRDVQVINDTVVIFAFVHFDERSLRTTFVTTDGSQEFYVFQNPRSDFSMIAIPKQFVDETLRNRSIYQRQNEDIVYRVGLQYKRISLNPSKVKKLFRIRWCHYQDTQLTPVLERSSRESTLPFIDEAIVYGAIEGIVIAKNEQSSLIWTPSMGCMQMSLAAFPTLRPLGDVIWVPPRRCLVENSFNFPCHYELFHDSRNSSWPNLKIIVNDRTKQVYIEGEGTCTQLKENEDKFGITVPHIGVVTNGLEKYQKKMAVGMTVYVRLGFEQLGENEPYDILVKEITMIVCESMISEELSSTLRAEETIPLISNKVKMQNRHHPSWATPSSSSSVSGVDRVEASSLRPSQSGAENCRIQSYRRVRGRDIRLGIRCWHNGIATYEELLEEIVYCHQVQRPMFAINEHDVLMAWRRKPRGDMLKMKQRRVTVIGVEKLDSRERFRTNSCEYESLVRFYVRSTDVAVVEKSVVIPVGGIYSRLPDDFVFGAVYTTMHLSSPLEPIPRIMGFGRGTGEAGFMLHHGVNPYQNNMVMRNHKGREWLRIQVNCNRPTIRKLRNDVFEIWKSLDISGLVIAEIAEMTLDELEPKIYEAYEMSCIIEPVAGGPFCITEIIAEDEDGFFANEENLIFWRVVTDFGKDEQKYKPHCVKKRKHFIVEEPPLPPEPVSRISVGESQYEIMKFTQQYKDNKVDQLRRLGDYRVQFLEGPELAPQLEARKISIPERHNKMLSTFDYLKVTLHFAHDKGLWTDLTYEMLTNQINEHRAMNDNNHEYNMTKRKRSLRRGCEYLMNLVSGEGVVVNMHVNYGEKVREILERIVSSLAFNRTFVKKTEQANKVFTYCYQKNVIEMD